MNVPAWAFSNLCIGRSYDANENRAGMDIFQPDIPIKTENVNTFSFRYKIVKSNEDVRDLLNISGDISLKIKANIFKVEGAGKYIRNSNKEEGTTEVLAVMKCTTVNKTMDGSAIARPEMEKAPSLGTHYVRSVTYGAEMIASLKFRSSSSKQRSTINGKLDGGLDIQAPVNAGLEVQLKKLSSECDNASDLTIEYYATDMPDKNPINLEDLVKLIQEFPSRLEKISQGQGVPIQIELQPIANVFPALSHDRSVRALECEINEVESRFDDLCQAKDLVLKYQETESDLDQDMRNFNSKITKTLRTFRSAISTLDGKKVGTCLKVYADSLDGNDEDRKFVRHWKDMLKAKIPSTNIELPRGKDLTVVLLGKTGNGKSATGNIIVGRDHFDSSADASAVTKECRYGSRSGERTMNVIDTPGVLDTSAVEHMKWRKIWKGKVLKSGERETQDLILREVCKIFGMAPQGFDAIALVVKYGARFTNEDEQALTLLQSFLGNESKEYMILILTMGDDAMHDAEKQGITSDELIDNWITTLPKWVQEFIAEIKNRVVLFNNRLTEYKNPEAFKKQLSKFIEVIDRMNERKGAFVHNLTRASREVLDGRIKEALDSSGFEVDLKQLREEQAAILQAWRSETKKGPVRERDRKAYKEDLQSIENKIYEKRKEIDALKATQRQEQVEEVATKSGGYTTKKVSGEGWIPCVLI